MISVSKHLLFPRNDQCQVRQKQAKRYLEIKRMRPNIICTFRQILNNNVSKIQANLSLQLCFVFFFYISIILLFHIIINPFVIFYIY